jgi:hypothetical protein
VPVTVVNMPFRPAMLQISSTGEADYQRYLDAMAGLRQQFGFQWLDYESNLGFDDQEFRDVDHLNAAGVRKISRRLGQDVAAVLSAQAAPVR